MLSEEMLAIIGHIKSLLFSALILNVLCAKQSTNHMNMKYMYRSWRTKIIFENKLLKRSKTVVNSNKVVKNQGYIPTELFLKIIP